MRVPAMIVIIRERIAVHAVLENVPYYLLSTVLATGCGIYAEKLPDRVLRVLLWPHALAVEVFFNVKTHFVAGEGYAAAGLPIFIGTQCSGISFICLTFLLLSYLFIHRFQKCEKPVWFVLAAILSVISGILLTTLRIIGSVPLVGSEQFSTFHAGVGISIYTMGLIAIYNAADRLTRKKH